MTALDPTATTAGDICSQALRECGAIGLGQSASAQDLSEAQMRLQWMLQQWERKSQLCYHLVDMSVVSTGAQIYTIGPGGDIDTNRDWNPFAPQFNFQFGPSHPVSVRPAMVESSFVRQLVTSQPNQIDYPMRLIQTRDDYNRIALKKLQTFPGYLFYDASWPLGQLLPWPVPEASIYELHVTVVEQLPPMFATTSTIIRLPFEYFNAMMLNLALRLRPKYGIPTYPGDLLPGFAKDSLDVLRRVNKRISQLVMPNDLLSGQQYNIFSDRMY